MKTIYIRVIGLILHATALTAAVWMGSIEVTTGVQLTVWAIGIFTISILIFVSVAIVYGKWDKFLDQEQS